VETTLGTVVSETRTFLILNSLAGAKPEAFFFERNPDIAAVLVTGAGGVGAGFTNRAFLASHALETSQITGFLPAIGESLERAASGEEIILNGSPYFGVPLLVILSPWNGNAAGAGGAAEARTAVILLSAEKFSGFFGSSGDGGNNSFLINSGGDILLHHDPELTKRGVNMREQGLVKTALDSGNRSFQTVYTGTDGLAYFGAYQKLSISDLVVITSISSDAVFRGISSVIRRYILVGAAVLALSILFIILYSRTISRPLKALAKASEAIEEGDYQVSLRHRSRDEIGVLTQAFIGMGLGLENFEKFTNRKILRLARQGKLTRSGVTRTVAVSFILIRNFNDFTEDMEAKDVVSFVNSFLSRIVPCITSTGGTVDKFLTQGGVVVMSLWGEAESGSDPRNDALACIRSSLMIRAVVSNWNAERASYRRGQKAGEYNSLIKIGCGINIGEVVVGQIGSEERMEYTVIGDAVNLAARMEGPNDLFDTDILISENTCRLIEGRIAQSITAGGFLTVEEMEGLEVKGKEIPLRVFSVVNMRDRTEAGKIIETLDKLPKTGPVISRRCVGPSGPRTMAEVRQSWRCFQGEAAGNA
jgi:adenylate cyclase